MDFEELASNLLNPKFSFKEVNFDSFVELAGDIVVKNELRQKLLGRLANELETNYGEKILEKLADEILNTTGYKISPSTLRAYRWVYQKVGHLDVPEDFKFHAWQVLSGTENPEEWLKKARDNGWSGGELVFNIRSSKGQKNIKTCPKCGCELK